VWKEDTLVRVGRSTRASDITPYGHAR